MNSNFLMVYGPFIIALVAAGVRSWLQARIAPDKLASAFDMARTAVRAAEELGGPGAEKFQVASDALMALARRVGFKLKPEEATSLIHAALFELRKLDDLEAEEERYVLSPALQHTLDNTFDWDSFLGEGEGQQADDPDVQNVLPFAPSVVSVEKLDGVPTEDV